MTPQIRPRRFSLSATAVFVGFLTAIMAGFLSSCESDPLLAPPTDEDKEKGSYGLSSLPGSSSGTETRNLNPELF